MGAKKQLFFILTREKKMEIRQSKGFVPFFILKSELFF